MTFARTSIALLAIQLAIVSSIAAKYLYQRATCPKVWTRAVAYDPSMVMRGRYLSTRLYVDTCGLTSPQASGGIRGFFGATQYIDMADGSQVLNAEIGLKANKLSALRFFKSPREGNSQPVKWRKSDDCATSELLAPVDFYISEKAQSPFPLSKGSELWVEVTVPPKGPPRPRAMATKDSTGQWQPLNYR